mgnify:FL=1
MLESRNNNKIRKILIIYIPLIFFLIFIFLNLINASIDKDNIQFKEKDFWFDRITKYVGTYKLIKVVTSDQDINKIIDDIENPFEGDEKAIKEGKKHYVLKGCASLHCHGPKGKGSGGPALNKGIFKHSDGSTYSLAYIITNGIAGTKMGAYGARLKDDEILKLIAYIRAETKK